MDSNVKTIKKISKEKQSLWVNFITSGNSIIINPLALRQLIFINSFSVLGFLSVAIFGTLHIIEKNTLIGIPELIGGVIFLLNLVILRTYQNVQVAKIIMLFTQGVLLLLLLITGGTEDTGIYWYFTFPVVAFFLMGKKNGMLWIAILFFATSTLSFLGSISYVPLAYTPAEIRQLLICLLVVCSLIYLYQKAIDDTEKEKQKASKALEESEAKAKAMLSSIGDAVFAIDKDTKIILFNHAAEMLSGYTYKEALGKKYTEILNFYNENDNSIVNNFITTALSGKKVEMPIHTRIKRKDGTSIPVADSAAPVVNISGNIEGAVIVFRNITRERELEKLKDEFLSIASHELRTPMTAIMGLTSMIIEGDYGPVNEKLEEPIIDIKTSTERLINLVNDILDISRIEAGRTKFALSEIPLDDTIQQVASTLQVLIKQKGLSFEIQDVNPASVQGDANKVQQILNNIFGNAIKFTEKGSISVTITQTNDIASVFITDTGIGISEDNQKTLFGKFQQVSSEIKGRPQGTGLGLYISRELARKMGGDLWIEKSEVGKGTTFGFSLPLAKSQKATTIKKDIENDANKHPDQK